MNVPTIAFIPQGSCSGRSCETASNYHDIIYHLDFFRTKSMASAPGMQFPPPRFLLFILLFTYRSSSDSSGFLQTLKLLFLPLH